MRKNLLPLTLWLAGSLAVGCVYAEKADRNKPMNIEADAMRYDDIKQISIFSGRVIVTKGSIQIRGKQIEVRQDPQGYQFGVVTGSPDAPAFFRQKRDGLDEYIEGEGLTIEYDGKADNVKFVNKAQMRRYRGATLADEVTGNLIVYENLTDIFTVDGGVRSAGADRSSGRVRAMLTPKVDNGNDKAAPQPPLPLRPASTLEGLR
jgi:lipopolysaccharide export system protein LptA